MPAQAASARVSRASVSGTVQAADAEEALKGGQGLRDRQAVQEAVDGADAQGVADGVDEEDQAVVPGAGGGVLRA